MKKTTLILVVSVFLLCAFFGFKFASKIIPDAEEVSTQEKNVAEEVILQKNFLLVHTSKDDDGKTQLVSAWLALVYPSDPTQIVFTPLFPSYEKRVDRRLGNSFKVLENDRLSSTFINQIEGAYDLEVSGYLIADDSTVKKSIIWFTGEEKPVIASVAETEEEKHSTRLIGQNSYQKFCDTLLAGSGAARKYFSSFKWTTLIPDHFSTDLSFEDFMITADQIMRSGSKIKCTVMSGE